MYQVRVAIDVTEMNRDAFLLNDQACLALLPAKWFELPGLLPGSRTHWYDDTFLGVAAD